MWGVFKPPGADPRSEGHRSQNQTADAVDAPQASAPEEEGATTRVPSMAHGAWLQWLNERAAPPREAICELSKSHGADNASNPRRATIPRTGGQPPHDRQLDATLLIRTVSARSCGPLPMCLRLATSSCMSLRCSTRLHATSCGGPSPSPLSSVGPLSVP